MTDDERTHHFNRSVLKKQFDKVFDEGSMELDSDQSIEPSFEGGGELEESKSEWKRKSRRSHVRKSDRQSSGMVKKKRTSVMFQPPAPTEEYVTVNVIQYVLL